MRVSKRTHRGWKGGGPALLGLVLLTGGAVFSPAAQAVREVQVFDVSVTIPTQDFYVLPITPGFLEREQQMIWDLVPGRLRPLREHFDVKSSAGGINARLGALPTLFNGGRTYIDLSVTFNGQVLSLEDTLVVPQDEARQGKRVLLDISAVEPPDGFTPGDYYGSVELLFDAVRP
ncbi:CS1 type fimbrial major subunit [Pseudomonas rhodesiae]|uniref:CS1 type fimbrial major subunit n=1 Tax=Pseudomonas rhodesiae TaxID=76760 RepID=UPI000B8C12EA|nr:CS1 type fimbrial major subunit [Pseudomonas rhodesiae]OXS23554.1 adhesin [Pseudomonas fluorescens]OZO49968.1 adhesin [Pseudomonas fluorescens]QVN02746.1 adhesin [Pseudomonas rhodesiae]TGY20398.1 adhesin [Pseudomonas fluorescens]WLG40600.1 CS1 type fimbrial major subunit [Pseudomonas rhodesiae]